MPALTREALQGGESVRRRTAATLALLGAPAGVGLALVAGPAALVLLGSGYAPADYAAASSLLRILSAAVPALFLNPLAVAALIAAGHASWLPRVTAARVALALALASALVPALGPRGAALGFVVAEWTVLALAAVACRRASFGVPVVRPLAGALLACVPMALAVSGVRSSLALAVPVGLLSFAATLAATWLLLPGIARGFVGVLRYP
jgi:O-antigen/teichoic acid export membrane protein